MLRKLQVECSLAEQLLRSLGSAGALIQVEVLEALLLGPVMAAELGRIRPRGPSSQQRSYVVFWV